jgi:hypothetical protein
MIHDAQVVHFLPGRIRLKSALMKGKAVLAQEVQQRLLTLPGILRVEAQPITGSVLILYDPASPSLLSTFAEACGWPAEATSREQREGWLWTTVNNVSADLATDVHTMLGSANAGAAALTGVWADLRALVPLALLFLGVWSLLLTSPLPLPQWYDFFWFASNLR